MEDLEEQLGAWQARSARYETARVAALLAELAARQRAAQGRGELPRLRRPPEAPGSSAAHREEPKRNMAGGGGRLEQRGHPPAHPAEGGVELL
jgi:hypothetical protein